jgi:glycosyltransferase involved in cell wall biosynthesis
LHYEHNPDASLEGPLVFFGRFEPTKGVDTLVEALGSLGNEAPRTLLIGRGPQQENLTRAIERYDLADRVRILPWMTHDELAQTLTTARLVVLPSREENFSLAVLSAMAVGAPVISTRVGGTPEIIKHGDNGWLVAPGEPVALAVAIRQMYQDVALAQRLGRAGLEHIRTHLTWDIVAKALEKIYRSVPISAAEREASLDH